MNFALHCVLFDLDGTLVDTAPDLGGAANLVRAELGLPPLPLAQYRPVASAGARGLLGVALGIAPAHADFPARSESFLRHYRANICRASVLFDGVAELLALLEQRGIRWGVVTNKPAWLTRPLMDELHLSSRAACVVSGDDVPRPKPAPDAILLACTQAALKPADCIYVGDDKRDIDAGRAAGLVTVAVEWGYLGENGAIETWQADAIVRTPSELASLIASPARDTGFCEIIDSTR
ncbi:MAG: HAD family hydrolase [Stenotrophobium sp.]